MQRGLQGLLRDGAERVRGPRSSGERAVEEGRDRRRGPRLPRPVDPQLTLGDAAVAGVCLAERIVARHAALLHIPTPPCFLTFTLLREHLHRNRLHVVVQPLLPGLHWSHVVFQAHPAGRFDSRLPERGAGADFEPDSLLRHASSGAGLQLHDITVVLLGERIAGMAVRQRALHGRDLRHGQHAAAGRSPVLHGGRGALQAERQGVLQAGVTQLEAVGVQVLVVLLHLQLVLLQVHLSGGCRSLVAELLLLLELLEQLPDGMVLRDGDLHLVLRPLPLLFLLLHLTDLAENDLQGKQTEENNMVLIRTLIVSYESYE